MAQRGQPSLGTYTVVKEAQTTTVAFQLRKSRVLHEARGKVTKCFAMPRKTFFDQAKECDMDKEKGGARRKPPPFNLDTEVNGNTALDVALSWARAGLPVFPCNPVDKSPLTPHGFKDATKDEEPIRESFTRHPDALIATPMGATTNMVGIDVDVKNNRNGMQSIKELQQQYGEFDTLTVRTPSGGEHYYFVHPGRPIRNRVDFKDGIDVRGDGGYIILPGSRSKDSAYRIIKHRPLMDLPSGLCDEMTNSRKPGRQRAGGGDGLVVHEGSRNDYLTRQAGKMRRAGLSEEAMSVALGVTNQQACNPPLDEKEVAKITTSIAGYDPADPLPTWPPLGEAALIGIAGDLTLAATRNSEADPAAVLLTILTTVSAAFGNQPRYLVGDTVHYPRLFCALVGESSRARKGTSTDPVIKVLEAAELELNASQSLCGQIKDVQPGNLKVLPGPLSTGEGLVYAVRDKSETTGKDGIPLFAGVADKRVLCLEQEFGAALRMSSRSGNTLSAILRLTWDHGNIAPLTKHARVKTTGAHICIVGHITRHELLALIHEADIWNGFANRFLWASVRRAKNVPFPESMPEDVVKDLAKRLAEAVRAAHRCDAVSFSDSARDIWIDRYDSLTEDRSGIYGAVTARAEAQVIRLALIYALLDCNDVITPIHLEAALAVWQFCDQSARQIFGDAEPDRQATSLLKALKERGEMSRTDINNLFGRNLPATRLGTLLERLQQAGKIKQRKLETGGRPVEMWSTS